MRLFSSHTWARRAGAALAVVAALSLAAGCATASHAAPGYAADSGTLVFAVVPDSVDTQTNYQPLMDYLAKKTGKKVEYHESTDYSALIEAAIAGKVDVASFSGFTYVTALNNGAKLEPISSIVTVKGQPPGYYSQAIAPAGSSVTSLADFAGKRVCFVDPSSTSGYLFPIYALMQQGIDPQTGITPVFAGKHDVSVAKVAAGKECEVGFAEDSEVARNDQVKVIDQTMVPGAPLVVSSALPQDVKEAVRSALENVTLEDIEAAGVSGADAAGFTSVFYATEPVTDGDYDVIRDICATTGATQCQSK